MWKGSQPASATARSPGVFRVIGSKAHRFAISAMVSPLSLRAASRVRTFQFDSGRSSHVGSGVWAQPAA